MEKLIAALSDLEDKYLERGIFSRFFEDDFDLSLKLVSQDDNFEIFIKLASDGECSLSKEEAEILCDKVQADFFKLVSHAYSKKESESAEDNFEGISLYLNEDLVY